MRVLSIIALVASAYAVERSTAMHRVRVANISLADKDTVIFADESVPRFSAVHADLSSGVSGGDFDLPPALDASGPNTEMGVDVSKFNDKIKAIDDKMVETRKKIKAAIVGCEKVTLLKSAYTAMNSERDRIAAKKRKVVLQAKLDKQNADLNVIDCMADNLRDRFSELRQTQSALRSNIQGAAEALATVMGKASKTPAGPAKSQLVSDMYDSHKDQVANVGATQAGNLDKLVDFFKDTLHMPVEDPSKPKPAPKKKASF